MGPWDVGKWDYKQKHEILWKFQIYKNKAQSHRILLQILTKIEVVLRLTDYVFGPLRHTIDHIKKEIAILIMLEIAIFFTLARSLSVKITNSTVNIKNGREKNKNKGLTVFSYSILSQLMLQKMFAKVWLGEGCDFAVSNWGVRRWKIAKNCAKNTL